MRLTVVGSGYVGLVTGVCLADTGNDVVGCDNDTGKIDTLKQGGCPIFEPGLSELLRANLDAGRLRFTTDMSEAVHHGEVIFVAVGTPARDDGSPDLTGLYAVVDEIAGHLNESKVMVIKSTVPIGTCDNIETRMARHTKYRVSVVSCPEFLKEGTAVDDFQRPDRVVIGTADPAAAACIRELHEPLVRNQRPIFVMPRVAAEMTKYAANAYLATRISFINHIANICDALGIDVNDVRTGIGSDARIGYHFLYPGAGYGGSCFPKDVQALIHVAQSVGLEADLLEGVHQVNQRQREILFEKIVTRFGRSLTGKCFAIWGAAFKPKTDDIREAPAVILIEKLLGAGASVRVSDPEALSNLQKEFGDRISYHGSNYEALNSADALVIVTEWNEYRSPSFTMMLDRLRNPIIFDGRNLYPLDTMRGLGFEYYSIGRPAVNSSVVSTGNVKQV